MAFADRVLTLKLVTDVGDIAGGMKKTTRELDKADDATKRFGKGLGRIGGKIKGIGGAIGNWGKAFAGAIAIEGIAKVTDALGDAWDGFRSGEKAAARLRGTFRNMGLSGTKATRAIDRIAKSTKRLGVSDDEAVDAMGILVKTTKGDLPEAFRRLEIAQDLVANGSAPNLAAAIKIIDGAAKGSAKVVDKWGLDAKTAAGRVDELGRSVKGAAKTKAALDPLGVLFNAMGEDLEGIVGAFAKGDFQGIVAAFGDLGNDIADALFGPAGSDNVRNSKTKGLVNQFGKWGSELAAGIATEFGKVDWGKTIGDTLNAAFGAVGEAAENGTLGNLAIAGLAIGGVFAGAMFTVTLLADALGLVMAAPAFLAGKGVKAAGNAIGLIFRGAMFLADMLARGLTSSLSTLKTSPGVTGAASKLGTSIGAKVVLALGAALLAAELVTAVSRALGMPEPGEEGYKTRARWNPVTKKLERYAEGTDNARAGWAIVGEAGPELMRLRGGETILPNDWGGAGTNVNVTIQTGVGDPIAIGRELDRVLTAYRHARGF